MKITGYRTWDPIYTGDGKKFKKAAHKRSLISKQNSFELAGCDANTYETDTC